MLERRHRSLEPWVPQWPTPFVIAGGVLALMVLALRPRVPPPVLDGTWTSGAYRVELTAPRAGRWIAGRDTTPFALDGPRGNRFCLHIPPPNTQCLVLIVQPGDTLTSSIGQTFRRVR